MGPFTIIRRYFTTFLDHHVSTEFIITNAEYLSDSVTQWPALESLKWLYNYSPCFPVSGSQISIIHNPGDFYNTLLEKCETAKERIVLASLYLGTGDLEKKLVERMHKQLQKNTQLTINILLDFTRGTRGEINSKTLLMPLIKESSNCFVSLYHTPVLRGLTKKLAPPRWNELLGLQHMKVYIFDNSVIISGANLSNDYFTNRQDRYVMINDESLANFYFDLVSTVQEFSLHVEKNSQVTLHKNWELLPYEGIKADFVDKARNQVTNYLNNVVEKQRSAAARATDADTWIFPMIEMGQLGIHHDSIITKKIFSSSVEGSRFKMATGYFNLTEQYMDTITNECPAHCSILMAHPNANGFQGAKFPAGGIPAAYSLIAKHFYENLVKAKQDHRINFYEYEKKGWTYHAKGLWYYLPKSVTPDMTLVGSSNFGERSVNRDLETQICIVTSNKGLSSRLQNEVEYLYANGSKAEHEITSRPVPKWVQAVVKVFRNFF